ncbi:MAG: hypothetical protein ACJ76N_06080 [Thermoanaerobaculia bacterium]
MESTKQSPSSHLFVVHAQDQTAVAQRLSVLGRVQPLAGAGALLLMLPAAGDARSVWSRAQEAVGSAGTVQPVLLDEEGGPHYPTGEVSVRFLEAPEDEELRRFAARHDLRLVRRNKFVPQQAVFQPLDGSGSYLPDLVERLQREAGTRAAWANTLSQYQRVA